jgi:hypothetical protein
MVSMQLWTVQHSFHTARHIETLHSPAANHATNARVRDHAGDLRENGQGLETGTRHDLSHPVLAGGKRLRGKRSRGQGREGKETLQDNFEGVGCVERISDRKTRRIGEP